jgi:CDGSH-type Zn-finger protein
MSDVRIRIWKDGPIEITGMVELVDQGGQAHPAPEDPLFLCRCGQSASKPFCDGTHRKCGFTAAAWTPTS